MEYCIILLAEHLSIAYISDDVGGENLLNTLSFKISTSFLANTIT